MKHQIEISYSHKNRNFYFRPLDRNVRGEFKLSQVAEPTAMSHRDRIPEEVPGQVLGIDTKTGTGYLIEPIQRNSILKARIEKLGFALEPERQEFQNVDVNEWLYWISAIVGAGKATVLNGELPSEISYDPPAMLGPKPKRGPARLREIFRDHPETAIQYLGWNESQKKEWEQLVGV